MRQILVVASLLVLVGWVPVVVGDEKHDAKHADKHDSKHDAKHDGKHAHAPVYQHGKDEFDLRKPEDKARLLQQLETGTIHHLTPKEEKSFLSYLADQAIWTLLVFGGLLFILWRYAWDPIQHGLTQREKSIEKAFEDAREARTLAESLKQDLTAQKARQVEEIRQMIDKARQDAQQTAAEELSRGRAELQAERERQLRELRIASDDALNKMWEQSAQLATLISAKAIRKQLSDADHRALLGEALAEFRGAALTRKENIESARA